MSVLVRLAEGAAIVFFALGGIVLSAIFFAFWLLVCSWPAWVALASIVYLWRTW